jgi:uroporphyrinogen decarboxylase
MTPRERWLAAIRRQPFDRIPTDFWATGEVLERLVNDLQVHNADEVLKVLKIDRVHSVSPRYIGPEIPGGNLWRIGFKPQIVAEGKGVYQEIATCPLAEMNDPAELDDFPWPSPDWYDYSHIKEDLDCLGAMPVCGGTFEPFNLYCAMRGLEKAFEDLAINPDFVEKALQKIFDYHYELIGRTFTAAGKDGGILFCYVAEDLGSQQGLMMSLATIERFFIPRMKAMIDLAHSYGVLAFHHDDGAIRKIIPRMIEIGIDILNPIQWRCPGMEREGLKRDFGEALTFHGAVDNQYTLPFGTPAEVRQEVFDNLRILGEGGGYILAPCHNIQLVSPTENILAMYDAADEYYGIK